MHLRSLGVRTEIMFAEEVIERDSYLVARTPSNPTFFWGNLLVFPEPPRAEDLAPHGSWMLAFERELPSCNHRSFVWDRVDAEGLDRAEWERLGLLVDETILFEARASSPPLPPLAAVRPIRSEWPDVFALLDRCFTPAGDRGEGYREFLRILVARYKKLVAEGLGQWFGLFRDGELRATCGVFQRDTLARFQLVAVDAEHRRQGLGAALVAEVARFARAEWPEASVLIGASPGGDAERIYRRLGFEPIEHIVGLIRKPARHG
jgi:GNAT superfamily N-acetyltransferase